MFELDLCDKIHSAHAILARSKMLETKNFLKEYFSVLLEKDFIFKFTYILLQFLLFIS